METNNPFQTNPVSTDNGKTAAIVSYFWFIGWLIAYFAMYKDNKTELARYQLRQTLLFHIATTVVSWGLGILFGLLIFTTGGFSIYYVLRAIQVGFFILWIIGLIGAINGEKKPIPFIGERAQAMFPSI
ncbi:DUF4870 domain-containing protein [Pedobacter aquatilis]|uniref:DUF4870 domain-containing protein n=1 Tax=Pedobacter aquatilis TaxID=351343 RepID=UPI0025B2A751|nr:DUF4870 domain-containing protein [Pedobacter aquatilis]MDN3586429.1 DUF4870 domain-containing protein [Pedobacter aquatilis]